MLRRQLLDRTDMTTPFLFPRQLGESPVVATAIHSSHALREDLVDCMALDEATRAREEDPYTDVLARELPSWILPCHSRFVVDLNRPPEEAFYRSPEMAWGLVVWKTPPSREMVARSLLEYDAFYEALYELLDQILRRHGCFVLLDLHDYNHRRAGPREPPADPADNPEVNIGTGSLDRERWGTVVDRFMQDLRRFDYGGRHLDVRENVKFLGRELARRVHQDFAGRGCVLAVEFKKIFMDEWTGILDVLQFDRLRSLMHAVLPGLEQSLESVRRAGLE